VALPGIPAQAAATFHNDVPLLRSICRLPGFALFALFAVYL
jgi:hypothetical protein